MGNCSSSDSDSEHGNVPPAAPYGNPGATDQECEKACDVPPVPDGVAANPSGFVLVLSGHHEHPDCNGRYFFDGEENGRPKWAKTKGGAPKVFWRPDRHSWDVWWGGISPEAPFDTPVPPLEGYARDQGGCDIRVRYEKGAAAEQCVQEFECRDYETVDISTPDGTALVIERATYGGNDPDRDMTEKVRALVKGNRLYVTGGIHTKIGDPEFGVGKVFRVKYFARGDNDDIAAKEGKHTDAMEGKHNDDNTATEGSAGAAAELRDLRSEVQELRQMLQGAPTAIAVAGEPVGMTHTMDTQTSGITTGGTQHPQNPYAQ